MGLQGIRRILSRLRVTPNWLLLLLGVAATVDAYLRVQIALETVGKFIIRASRGEAINIFGDRIWNILFLVSSILVVLIIWRDLTLSLSRSVNVEVTKD